MKFLTLADLHLDFHFEDGVNPSEKVPEEQRHAANRMIGYHYIRVTKTGYKKLTSMQTAQIHTDHRRWLEEFEGEDTVVTHHAPHLKALKGTPAIGPCYAANIEALILNPPPSIRRQA